MSSSLEAGMPAQRRSALKVSGTALALLSFQTLGIIYSDIGTSPLYVLNGIWPAAKGPPSSEDVLGGVSAIIWALTLLPLIKYVGFALNFGTGEGEGGSFALFQGLYPPTERDYDADRTLTGEDFNKPVSVHSSSRNISKKLRWPLLCWSLFGTSLTMADGILTPAVSVTSAVGGIAVAKPSVSEDTVPISIAFLLALFLAQRFGTGKLSGFFSPIAMIWFLLLMGTGIYNITAHPGIFRAFDPSRAVLFFVRTGDYDLLAGVLLAVTGSEAMFANLGQFNAFSIRISFGLFVYPALVLAYLGQGAQLITRRDEVISNVFYSTIPGPVNGGLYWVMFIFALLATLIASQAMITATFSLVQQIVNMRSLPPIRMLHTSEKVYGQIYVPVVNWILMIGTIALVGGFKDLSQLTNAYGFAVATVMFSTTGLLAIQMSYVKHWPFICGFAFFLVFGFFDGLFWGASLKKVPHGAWVPLMLGCILAIVMLHWTWAKRLEDKFDGANRRNLRSFIFSSLDKQSTGTYALPSRRRYNPVEETHSIGERDDDYESDEEEVLESGAPVSYYFLPRDVEESSGVVDDSKIIKPENQLARTGTCAVFHKVTFGTGVPHTFIGFIRQWPALPRVVIFLSVCVVPIARVPVEDRYVVNKVRSIEGFYGVTYYIGFRDYFDVKVEDVVDRICALEMTAKPKEGDRIVREIRAAAKTATHIAPHYHVVSRHINAGRLSGAVNWVRAFLIEELYRRLAVMFPETANWLTSADEIIHVGINAVI